MIKSRVDHVKSFVDWLVSVGGIYVMDVEEFNVTGIMNEDIIIELNDVILIIVDISMGIPCYFVSAECDDWDIFVYVGLRIWSMMHYWSTRLCLYGAYMK